MANPEEDKAAKPEDTETSLSDALAELAALVQPEEAVSPAFMELKIAEYFYFLLTLWASFRVYQIEPFVEPDEEGGNAGSASIIVLDNGHEIYDYGYYLCTSTGEHYSSYCTGKLIEAVQEMIHQLAKRGATLVGFSGHEIAKRAAWVECLEQGIEISNFMPAAGDWELYERIRKLKEQRQKATAERRPA